MRYVHNPVAFGVITFPVVVESTQSAVDTSRCLWRCTDQASSYNSQSFLTDLTGPLVTGAYHPHCGILNNIIHDLATLALKFPQPGSPTVLGIVETIKSAK